MLKYGVLEAAMVALLLWSQPRAPIKLLPDDVVYGFVGFFMFIVLVAAVWGLAEEIGQRLSSQGISL
jgi:hypothetical protein